ncbi:MAG TPA: glycosyltransferase [Granulicella sp.]|jgi:glycosyltransferase involved in cell wall biosynthesis|nr:glycosyltransferase [Granulicella sp.]
MRILHLIATLNPRAGGPANSVRRIAASYPQIDSQGEILTLDSPNAPYLREPGLTVHALGPVHNKFGYTPNLIPWLLANRDRFDGVVLHGLWEYLGYAVRHTIAGRRPYMVFTHGMLDPYFKRVRPLKHLKKTLYWWLNEYWLLRGARFVLFTSVAESQLATQSFWPHHWTPRVVPYGASPCPGDPAQLRTAFLDHHPDLRTPDGTTKPFVLFLSRIHPKKGCDLLLDAFGKIAAQHPTLHLVLVGPDPHYIKPALAHQAYRAGLGSRVHLLPMLEGEQKWGAFCAAQVFALPSHQENFGIAVAEALACAKPVLVSDKVNIWQEIVADGAGLAAPDDAEGTLATLTQWLALPPAEQAAMSNRALTCFQTRYDMDTNAQAILRILSELAPPPAPQP